MKLLVSEIPKEGIDVEVRESLDSDDAKCLVEGILRVMKSGSEILVNGVLKAAADVQCSRCLKKFTADLSIPVNVAYHPAAEMVKDGNYEVTVGELDLDFYTGDEFDVNDLVNEQVALNMPMKPLCDDSCRGLCPNCGVDLNLSSCTCSLKSADARFKDLKKLSERMKGVTGG